MSGQDRRLLVLSAEDTVCVACATIPAGERVLIDGVEVVLERAIDIAHKVARADLAEGARVLKYGAPIGSLTQPVHRGEWVHTHNMRSDYLPTYTLDAARAAAGEEEGGR